MSGKNKIIGVDLDGVLVDFNTGYARLIKQAYGLAFPPYARSSYPQSWYWEREGGLTKEQEKAVWKTIGTSETFWKNLPEYPWANEAVSALLRSKYLVYFITSRPQSPFIQWQCAQWLKSKTLANHWSPSVVVVKNWANKIPIIKALGVTHFIDDKWETMEELSRVKTEDEASGDTFGCQHFYLFDQPWNRRGELPHVRRVENMNEFLKEIQ